MVEGIGKTGPGLTARGWLARFFGDPPKGAVLAACALVLGLRRAEALTRPQFWAEDAYFFERAYVLGWASLRESYAGYLHTVLRLIAEAAVSIDPARAPAIFVAAAGLLTLYVASRTLSDRCPLPRLGGAFALALVLVPNTYEVLLTVVNLQWVLAAGLLLLLLSRDPVGAGSWVHDLAAAALLGLTGPYSVLLAPLFAWRAWRRRTRASVALAAIIAACALAQLYFLRTEPQIVPPKDRQVAGELILPTVGHSIGASILLGRLEPRDPGLAAGTILGLATLAAVGYLAFRPGALREERAWLGVAFGALLFGALLRSRYSLGVYFQPLGNGRYVYLPQLIALWLLLLAAREKGRTGRIAALLAVLALVVNLPRLREPAFPDLHWERYAPQIRAGQRVVVPVNPPGWVMPLPARPR
jgi:hypothetical protein